MCGYLCTRCGKCGKTIAKELEVGTCLSCGAKNPPGTLKCASCGSTLVKTASPGIATGKA